MIVRRFASLFLMLAALAVSPAKAQLFWLPPEFSGAPLLSYEPGMGVPLPGATTNEQNAAIMWGMRSGLNVAALQCGFEPTLRTLENYNAMISNHGTELAAAFATLGAYFKRTSKTAAAGQKALDTFGTRTYSGYSTVSAQKGFCTAAGKVGRSSLFAKRGQFLKFAQTYLRELRNSLILAGEQQFRFARAYQGVHVPRFDAGCWKRDTYIASCGWDQL
jgi:hypothetical protein